VTRVGPVRALLEAWWLRDFFADSRRAGRGGSSLTTTIFTQSFLALVFAALLFPETPPIPFAAANLSLSSLLVGIGLLGEPDRLLRPDADELLLRSAPLRRTSLALARAVHGSFGVALVTTGMAIPPAVLGYWLHGARLLPVLSYLLLATVVAAITAGALALLGRLLVLAFGLARGLLALGTAKALLLGGGFVGFAIALPHLRRTAAELPLPGWLVQAWPPYLAARAVADPVAHAGELALLAGLLLGLLAAAALLERPARRAGAARVRPRGPLRALLQRLPRTPAERGGALFVATMLARSPGYRARVLPLFGVPLAMALLAFRGSAGDESRLLLGITLQFPAIYLPFLIAFLPHSDQRGVRWLFASAPIDAARLGRRAALLASATHVLLPALLLAALLAIAAGQPPARVGAIASFAGGIGLVVARFAVARLDVMPFTVEGQDDGEGFELGSVLVWALLLTLIGAGHAMLADGAAGWLLAAGAISAGLFALRPEARGAV
jgi:hypothetical protein